ncbi:OTU family ubiquitin thioesterase [Rhodotorula paludigena]|uniref:OTU family ubiquitin thioesterase n=1 Tax=Rhodotorula paludigena TaxID=86838 RepID=UPI0031726F72
MAAPPDPDRPLGDLTDAEIAQLTAQLKDDEASQRPLVGSLEPLADLAQEYTAGSAYRAKVERLRLDGWTSLRRARGDGDCFYRSFVFALLETYLPLHPTHAAHLFAKFDSLLPLLTASGFEQMVWEDFWEPLRDLLYRMGPEEKDGGRRKDGEARLTREGLLEALNDQETNSCIIVILRLITSAYLRTHEDEFSPFLFALDDDPRFIQEGGAPTMRQFCEYHVEAVSREADHLAITALTRALQVPLRIAYLDQSGLPQFGAAVDDAEVNFVEFEEEAAKRGERGIDGALLYRPGHYDMLSR